MGRNWKQVFCTDHFIFAFRGFEFVHYYRYEHDNPGYVGTQRLEFAYNALESACAQIRRNAWEVSSKADDEAAVELWQEYMAGVAAQVASCYEVLKTSWGR
ncbi:MAG: hypothetical protein Q9171_004406 [Xanthocarpia ochracea]